MNKVIAFCQNRKVYLPELNQICGGNVIASLLMGQLEYWFSKQNNGFYKFLSPCNHPRYVRGDSWTEEMNFSECQFRAAFDKIGVRYRSYSQMKEVMDRGEDRFRGALYLSYFDPQTKVTIYLRNNLVVDEALSKVLDNFKPGLENQNNSLGHTAITPEPLLNPQLRNSNLRNSDLGISKVVTEKILGTLPIRNTKITTKITAAAKKEKNENAIPSEVSDHSGNSHFDPGHTRHTELQKRKVEKKIAAANCFENNLCSDGMIGERLTQSQQKRIEMLSAIAGEFVPGKTKKALCRAIEREILNPQCFSQAGKNFEKKYNTIKKQIAMGKWAMPTEWAEKDEKKKNKLIQEAERHLREANGEYAHWTEMLDTAKQRGDPDMMTLFRHYIESAREKIKHVQQHFQALQASPSLKKQGMNDDREM